MTGPDSKNNIPPIQRIVTRITAGIALLVILMILISGFEIIWIASTEQENTIYQFQKISAEETSLIISSYFSNLVNNLTIFSKNSHLSELDINQQKKVLIDLLNDEKNSFHECTILTPDGRESVKISQNINLPDEYKNLSSDPLFIRALKGESVISPIFISPQTGLTSVKIATPVRDNQGKITHVLIITGSLLPLWSEIEKIDIGRNGYTYIIDNSGRLIAYQVTSETLDRYGELITALPPVQRFISGEQLSGVQISSYTGLYGEEVIGSFTGIAGTDWAVITELPTYEAFEYIYRLIQVIITTLIVGIIFSGLLGFILSKYLTDPLLNLTNTVALIGQGNLETLIHETNRGDEIGVLASGIEQMQKSLRESYLDLELRISELTLAREKLRFSEEQYRVLFEQSEEPLILVEKDSSITLVNKKFEELWGFSREEIIGKKKWTEYVSIFNDLNKLTSFSKQRYADDENIPKFNNIRLKKSTGELRDILASETKIPENNQTLVAFIDITDQKRYELELIQKNKDLNEAYEKLATNEEELRKSYNTLTIYEQKLRKSEQKYRNIVEDQTDLVFRFTPQKKIIFGNDAFFSFFQVEREDVMEYRVDLSDINLFSSEILDQISSLSSSTPILYSENKIIMPEKEDKWVNTTIRGIFSDSGHITEYQSVARDISFQKKAEEALEMSRNKLNLLNAITFDDIRNYIFTLSGYLEIKKDMISDPDILELVEIEQSIVKKVTQSLNFAKDYQDMGNCQPNWQNVLQVYLFAISHLDMTHIERIEEIQGILIYADQLLEKVFYNLAINMATHGKDIVTKLHLHYELRNDKLIIIFEDNGPGIPDEQKESLFSRRNDLKKGLGLFFVGEVLAITGINIKETGIFGKGARFEIIVPRGKFKYE
ncbi:cache domain-containing protein [Methanospirillum sp.]|uniref:cache domain-containing protein n=1 Tax=Methanospirillum sp. TaxID=45200 RepID=UPI0035A14A5B